MFRWKLKKGMQKKKLPPVFCFPGLCSAYSDETGAYKLQNQCYYPFQLNVIDESAFKSFSNNEKKEMITKW